MKQIAWVPAMDSLNFENIREARIVTGLGERDGDGWILSDTFSEKIRAAGSTEESPGYIVTRVGEDVLLEAFTWTGQAQPVPLHPSVVDVGTITEYGLSQRLSTPIRCF